MLVTRTRTNIATQHKGHQHTWGKTQREIPGAIIYFNGYTCGKLKAYDLEITSPERLSGRSEYDSRLRKSLDICP